ALVGVGDALVGVGDALVGVGDALVGVGDAPVGAFITVIIIVSELSVLVTVTLIWLLPTAEVLETVPLKAHPVCAENKTTKMLSTAKTIFILYLRFSVTNASLVPVLTSSHLQKQL